MVADIRAIKSIKDVRGWLGMSLLEMAEACQTSKASVASWQKGNPIMAVHLERITQLMVNRLSEKLGRDDIGIKPNVNSPLRFVVYARCTECHSWFELRHGLTRRCERCRS